MKSIFITGTDTEIGKTYVSCLILEKLKVLGFKTVAMKPIATGGVELDGHLVNEDVTLLQQAASEQEPYTSINPISFEMPVSPNIAAAFEHKSLKKAELLELIKRSVHVEADYRIIEGVGGWMVPLGSDFLLAALVHFDSSTKSFFQFLFNFSHMKCRMAQMFPRHRVDDLKTNQLHTCDRPMLCYGIETWFEGAATHLLEDYFRNIGFNDSETALFRFLRKDSQNAWTLKF